MAQKADSLNVEPIRPRLAPVPPLLIEKPPQPRPLATIKKAAVGAYRSTQARASHRKTFADRGCGRGHRVRLRSCSPSLEVETQ